MTNTAFQNQKYSVLSQFLKHLNIITNMITIIKPKFMEMKISTKNNPKSFLRVRNWRIVNPKQPLTAMKSDASIEIWFLSSKEKISEAELTLRDFDVSGQMKSNHLISGQKPNDLDFTSRCFETKRRTLIALRVTEWWGWLSAIIRLDWQFSLTRGELFALQLKRSVFEKPLRDWK